FYRLPETRREPIIDRYIANSWFNLGISHLQGGNVIEARNCFNEVLALDTSDAGAKREKEFCDWYLSHQRDSSFINHIDSLKFRNLTD
ncbi:MAG: tetratricopeptide repeat protein, partial [Acidobacteriota bacterium]